MDLEMALAQIDCNLVDIITWSITIFGFLALALVERFARPKKKDGREQDMDALLVLSLMMGVTL